MPSNCGSPPSGEDAAPCRSPAASKASQPAGSLSTRSRSAPSWTFCGTPPRPAARYGIVARRFGRAREHVDVQQITVFREIRLLVVLVVAVAQIIGLEPEFTVAEC